MNYEYLVETSKTIPSAGVNAISEYFTKSESLIASVNMQLASREDLHDLIGKNNLSMMKDNHTNHVLFIHSILKNPNPIVLVDTLLWVFKTYRSRGFAVKYWVVQTDAWLEALNNQLSKEAYLQILPLYKWIQENLPLLDKLSALEKEQGNAIY